MFVLLVIEPSLIIEIIFRRKCSHNSTAIYRKDHGSHENSEMPIIQYNAIMKIGETFAPVLF